MAFTFRAAGTAYSSASSATVSPTLPTGHAAGDFLVCIIGRFGGSNPDPAGVPSGWTLAGKQTVTSGLILWVYWKVDSGSESAPTWTWTGALKCRGKAVAYYGDYNTADPIDVVSNTAYVISDTTLRAATMTTTADNEPIIFLAAHYATSARTCTPPSVPAAFAENVDEWDTTSDMGNEIALLLWTSSGATGSMDGTVSTATTVKAAFAIALKVPTVLAITSGAQDGYIESYSLTWATARGAASGGVTASGDLMTLGASKRASDNYYFVWRMFLPFDRSAVVGTVTAATLALTRRYGGAEGNLCLFAGTQADTLVGADFDAFGTTELAARVAMPTTNDTAVTFTLNAAGIAYLNAGGSKFCVRVARDADNSAPTAETYNNFATSESTTGAWRPTLTVTYTPATAPIVTTQAVDAILATTATGHGTVTSDGGATIVSRGVLWATTSGPTWTDSYAVADGTTGAYSAPLTGLTPGTLYYVRSYASNSVGTSYGAEVTFTSASATTTTFAIVQSGGVTLWR